MDELEMVERITAVEQRAKSNTYQIGELKTIAGSLQEMSGTLILLVEQMKNTNTNVSEMREKIDKIEKEPAENWKESSKIVRNAIIGAIVGAVVTGVGAAFLYAL